MNGLFSAKLVMPGTAAPSCRRPASTARGYIRAIDRLRIDMVILGADHAGAGHALSGPEALAQADLGCVTVAVTGSLALLDTWRVFRSRCTGFFPTPRRPTAGVRRSRARLRSARIPGRHRQAAGRALGYPRKGIDLRFVGDDPNQGVLHIRTPALMSGYLNRETDTKKRLIDGWYGIPAKSARRDDNGFCLFQGRTRRRHVPV